MKRKHCRSHLLLVVEKGGRATVLVQRNVCSKINAKSSLGGAEYFMAFIDDFDITCGSAF